MASQQSYGGYTAQTQGSLNFSQDAGYNFLDYGTQDFTSVSDYPQFAGLSQVFDLFQSFQPSRRCNIPDPCIAGKMRVYAINTLIFQSKFRLLWPSGIVEDAGNWTLNLTIGWPPCSADHREQGLSLIVIFMWRYCTANLTLTSTVTSSYSLGILISRKTENRNYYLTQILRFQIFTDSNTSVWSVDLAWFYCWRKI